MKARHIPTAKVAGFVGFALCGRIVRWRRLAAEVRKAYDDPRNREGACKACVAKLEKR
jgi:hypothetical protein